MKDNSFNIGKIMVGTKICPDLVKWQVSYRGIVVGQAENPGPVKHKIKNMPIQRAELWLRDARLIEGLSLEPSQRGRGVSTSSTGEDFNRLEQKGSSQSNAHG